MAEDDGAGNAKWMLGDAESSVRQILSSTGTTQATYDYDAFGNIIEPDPSLPAGVVAHNTADGSADGGDADPNWTISTGGGSGGHAVAVADDSHWMIDGNGVGWIGPQDFTDVGTFDYTTTITVPAGVTSLPFDLAVDNDLLSVTVTGPNGTPHDAGIELDDSNSDPYSRFLEWHSFTLSNLAAGQTSPA